MLIYIALSFNASASAPYLTLDSANKAYSGEKYDKAITMYNSFINDGYESSQVYFNLGNCYYRKADYARAILNYEKAKKLNPSDADIQFNLQIANLKTTDKITPDSELFLANWWHKLVDISSEKGWAITCILLLFIALLSISSYLVSRNLFIRQLGFWLGMLLLAFSLITFLFSREQYNAITSHDTAIVMSGSVTVKASPADNGTQLFIIHEGAKVWIVKSEGTWTEVKLANGSQGWLLTSDIEAI
ncbi:MAG TPA: tetratricopeptide repeat protein [Bacteroidia bacterium]|nr:tetratricopeptide repeat protein [Bacteroidia bacterium]